MKRNHISELMDGELKGEEADALLARLGSDEGLATQWARYHLISDVLSSHLTSEVGPELRQRVRNALEGEPHYLVSWRERLGGARRLGTGLALAATLAGVAVIAGPWLKGGNGFSGEVTVAQVAGNTAAPGAITAPPARRGGMRWNHVNSAAEQRLNGFLVSHSTHVERMSPMRAYARVVSYHGSR